MNFLFSNSLINIDIVICRRSLGVLAAKRKTGGLEMDCWLLKMCMSNEEVSYKGNTTILQIVCDVSHTICG
jgi:hypothetical protein